MLVSTWGRENKKGSCFWVLPKKKKKKKKRITVTFFKMGFNKSR
jgi:hypothetical protein